MSESAGFLIGAPSYLAELPFDGLQAVFVRSTVAHATIVSIDERAAHDRYGYQPKILPEDDA